MPYTSFRLSPEPLAKRKKEQENRPRNKFGMTTWTKHFMFFPYNAKEGYFVVIAK